MVRRYAETVQVQAGGADRPGPCAFVWRGRRYVVRGVLGHWRERRAWWAGAAASVVHGTADQAPAESGSDLDGEREVWRVEASSARGEAPGVYDLVHEPDRPAGAARDQPAGDAGAWRLLRVAD